MKTILAPVDFSEASTNALLFAAELARRATTRLVVVNILQKDEAEEEIQNKLNGIVSDLKKSLAPGLNCDTSFAHGELIDTLKKIITIQQPDLVVMGTKGASGLKGILLGSNTVNLIAATRVPVLVIPEVARFESMLLKEKNRIVLATDLDEFANDEALYLLKQIAQLIIEPKLRVLNVRQKNTGLSDLKRMERHFLISFFEPEIDSDRVTVFSSSVMGGINFYLDKNTDSGLIAMIARDSGALIQKHYTKEMASHTHLPLLVLHDAV